jgi:hypothetical protein
MTRRETVILVAVDSDSVVVEAPDLTTRADRTSPAALTSEALGPEAGTLVRYAYRKGWEVQEL